MHTTTTLVLLLFLFSLQSFNVGLAENVESGNPFTPKGYLIRYWKKQVSNDLPKPWFFLNKASPLNAAQFATYSKLAADQNSLSTQIHSFCTSANLLCSPDLSPSLEKHSEDVNFKSYSDKNFTNYGTNRPSGLDSFKNYSDDANIAVNSFRRYSRGASGHDDKFSNYVPEGNVVDQSFNTYGANGLGGAGKFTNYGPRVNVPNLEFTSYSDQATGRKQDFTTYTKDANAGDQSFTNYGKNGVATDNQFNSYGNDSNVMGSTFTNYGKNANGGNQVFRSYGFDGNLPVNNFKNYGEGGNGPSETFTSYRDQSNIGDDNFQNYVTDSNAGVAKFINYGRSFNEGNDKFTTYGKNGNDPKIDFKTYGVNNTFKDYAKSGSVTFSNYRNKTSQVLASLAEVNGGQPAKNRWVEPGKFFREKMLKTGTVMPMPDIKDKMPKRSFLPRVIVAKLPFSTSKIGELKKIFHAGDDTPVAKMIGDAVSECERAPSAGETKRCVSSAEDMIDFSTSVLGRNVVVRSTENTKGSKQNIMVGQVKGINGGEVTKSVSCHQTLFPYLLYYCHSVPKVRVYEADILDPNSKVRINHGVAICHVDTSSWSSGHGAFIALGSGPGKIEVCHWIFENDMTWAVAD